MAPGWQHALLANRRPPPSFATSHVHVAAISALPDPAFDVITYT